MSFIYFAERTTDCDGSGWAFWRFDLDPAIVEAYEEAVMDWERARATAIDGILLLLGIHGGRKDGAASYAVNKCMFDSSADKQDAVRNAYTVMRNRLGFIADAVKDAVDHNRRIPSVDECDVVGYAEFRSRYLPIIMQADSNNDREPGDAFSHEAWLSSNGYTSIFNGR